MEVFIKESLKSMKYQEEDTIIGQMVKPMKVIGKRIKCMVKVF
jgi:hypothetical protein